MLDWVWYSVLNIQNLNFGLSFSEVRHSLFNRFKSWIELYICYLRYWIFYIQNLNVEYRTSKEVLGNQFLPFFYFFLFFEKRFLISQLTRIHILFRIQMGPSVDITPHGDPQRGGGYSDLFFIRRLGPRIYRSPPKISGTSSTPKNILHTPKNIHFSENQKEYWNSKFWAQKLPKPTYVWKYLSTPSPPPPPRPPGTETLIRWTLPCGQRMKNPNSVFNVKLMLLYREDPTVRSQYVLVQSLRYQQILQL